MIIKAFSNYLKTFNTEIPSIILLSEWLKIKLLKNPENNIEKIINEEIGLLKNKIGFFY